mmetsp:Transcript_14566/g.31535  ORF Transcript_14566/g.31535 Transcript_14566/m.31535 type:complete len:126 (-) Transcript_14566:1439-1816(-)
MLEGRFHSGLFDAPLEARGAHRCQPLPLLCLAETHAPHEIVQRKERHPNANFNADNGRNSSNSNITASASASNENDNSNNSSSNSNNSSNQNDNSSTNENDNLSAWRSFDDPPEVSSLHTTPFHR